MKSEKLKSKENCQTVLTQIVSRIRSEAQKTIAKREVGAIL
jgi:hypothetical protein